MQERKKKTLGELRRRAATALTNEELVQLASSFSPTGAYDWAVDGGFSPAEARSCRFLAMIRRDYPDDFPEICNRATQMILLARTRREGRS